MSRIIFFDTETTGNTEKDFLCQIAYKSGNDSFVGLYKPPIKVPPEASAVHHITNKMLENKPAFMGSGDFSKIKEFLENKNAICTSPIHENISKSPKFFVVTVYPYSL